MANIKVSSEQLESMAGEIKTIGTELDSIINEAGGLVTQIGSVWEGLAQASFMADYNSQKENRKHKYPCCLQVNKERHYDRSKYNKGRAEQQS